MHYYLCVLSIFKNEGMNIREWIEHYLWQGVDHFVLIDNGSTDNYYVHLKPYIKQGLVTLIHLNKPSAQVEHYNYVLNEFNLRYISEWLIVCDLDEFYFATRRDGSRTVREYLQKVALPVSCIYTSMTMFASRDEYQHPPSIRRAFMYREAQMHDYGKAILRCNKIQQLHVHRHNVNGKTITEDDMLQLNHYIIQSKEYFDRVKKTRGDVMSSENARDDAYFKRRDLREVYDDLLVRILDQDAGVEWDTSVSQSSEVISKHVSIVFLVGVVFILFSVIVYMFYIH